MKKIFLVVMLLILISMQTFAQLKSVNVFMDYSFSPSKRLQITNADAVGGGVKINIRLFDNLNFTVKSGYKLYTINEPDVLNNWGWKFWTERYYNKIVSDLNADPNLSVQIGAIQKMDIIPLVVSFGYDFSLFDNLVVSPSCGAGVYFFTRRMYATENWSKYFPTENYTFSYSYRNFAPDKKGNPFILNGNISLEYNLFKSLNIFSSFDYTYVIPTEGTAGYDVFPFNNSLCFGIGISILY